MTKTGLKQITKHTQKRFSRKVANVSNLSNILKAEKALKDKRDQEFFDLEDKRFHSIRHSQIRCSAEYGCGKSSELRLWTLQQRYFWDENTGSPNGGFWSYGEPKFDTLVCPKCSYENYVYTHLQVDKILLLREAAEDKEEQIFKAVTKKKQ